MKITENQSEQNILIEIGERIKQQRIALNITQKELADQSGVSLSTETRIENGTDSKISNYIKLLRVLNLLQNFDLLVPATEQNFKDIFEDVPARKRATKERGDAKKEWIWGEDI